MGRLITVTMALMLVCLCAQAQQPAFTDMRVLEEVKAQLQTHRAAIPYPGVVLLRTAPLCAESP